MASTNWNTSSLGDVTVSGVARLPDPDLTPSAPSHEGLRQLDPEMVMTAPGSATLSVPWDGSYAHDGDDDPITGSQAPMISKDGSGGKHGGRPR